MGLLESALAAPFMEYAGEVFFHTKEEKAARLGYGLMTNHAFIDGNKRIGCKLMLMFLDLNGIDIECTQQEIVDIGLGVGSGKMSCDELLRWIIQHKVTE